MGFGEPITFTLGTSELRAVRIFVNGAQKTDLSAITRWVAVVAGSTIDSATSPTCFNWTGYTDTDGTSDILVLDFGSLDLAKGPTSLVLTYYDVSNPAGKQLDNVIPAYVQGTATGAAPTKWLQHSYGTDAPASGTYGLGDIQWNSAPAVGAPYGWVCTVAGSPGTWGTMGTLN